MLFYMCFSFLNCSHLQLSRMKYAQRAISTALEKIALGSLNGFGVERHTWQREGLMTIPLLFIVLKQKTAMSNIEFGSIILVPVTTII